MFSRLNPVLRFRLMIHPTYARLKRGPNTDGPGLLYRCCVGSELCLRGYLSDYSQTLRTAPRRVFARRLQVKPSAEQSGPPLADRHRPQTSNGCHLKTNRLSIVVQYL